MAIPAMAILGLLSALGAGGAAGMASANQGGSFWGGSPGQFQQVGTLNDQQMQLLQGLLPGLMEAQGSGLGWINDILSGDEEAFSKFEAPFKRQFEQETVPGIAERFAGLGTGGAQSSSAMDQTMGQAGRELSESLAALRGNLQQNALGQLQGLLGRGMQPTFQTMYQQPTQGAFGGLASGLGSGAGTLFGLQALKSLGVS